MKLKVKVDMRRLRAKCERWMRRTDAAQLENVRAYGAEAAQVMVKCTPPGNARRAVSKSLTALKRRIREDFEGTGMVPFQDEHLVWRRNHKGELYATFAWWDGEQLKEGKASPFRVYTNKPTKAKLAALNVGHRVHHATNVREFISQRPGQYKFRRVGNAVRFSWEGVRHVASMAAVRREIRRRQQLAGTLMAGWKPLARKARAKLPRQIESKHGLGSASVTPCRQHKVSLVARNRGNYKGLQRIVDRQVPGLRRKLRSMARRRAKMMKQKLK